MRMDVKFTQSVQNFSGGFEDVTLLNGATFTPHVSEDGVLSWSNDKKLPNPTPVQISGGTGTKAYYHTERDELGVEHGEINSNYIFGLYRDLINDHAAHEGEDGNITCKIREKEWSVQTEAGTFVNYEYVISTGEYREDGELAQRYKSDSNIKKPKYLILSGIHGQERKAVFSVYRFIRDLLSGHNMPQTLREGANIHVLPVANPTGFDAFVPENGNGQNINRDFLNQPLQPETQLIIHWMQENADAELFMDIHNSGSVNEVAAVLGDSDHDATHMAKTIALRGINRVIPYWRDVIGYPAERYALYLDENGAYALGNQPVIYAYAADSTWELEDPGYCTSMVYASQEVGIPGICVELCTYYGDYPDWQNDITGYPAETIAAGAEAIGNILLEFYDQFFFGEVKDDMKQIDSKLDTLAKSMNTDMEDIGEKIDSLIQSQSFRVESGIYTVPTTITTTHKINIPCTSGAKAFEFYADNETMARIKATTGTRYIGASSCKYSDKVRALSGGMQVNQYGVKAELCEMQDKTAEGFGWVLYHDTTSFENTNGVSITARAILNGTYHWRTYYWND